MSISQWQSKFQYLNKKGYASRVSFIFFTSVVAVLAIATVSHAGIPTYSGGGPSGGQTFVPLDALLDVNMNEAVKAATATTANITLKKCLSSSDASSCSGIDSENKCTGITVASANIRCDHAALNTNTTYEFRVTTSVQSNSTSQGAAADFVRIFRTSNFDGGSNSVPPRFSGCFPVMGAQNAPTNTIVTCRTSDGPESIFKNDGSANAINNSANVSLRKVINGVPDASTELCPGVNCTVDYNAGTKQFFVIPSAVFASDTEYMMCIAATVQNMQNVPMGMPFCTRFRTGSAADLTGPTLRSSNPSSPADGASSISKFKDDISVSFSEPLQNFTGNIRTTSGQGRVGMCADANANGVCDDGGSQYIGNAAINDLIQVQFDVADNTGHFLNMGPALSANTKYCLEVVGGAGGMEDMYGNLLATTQKVCFTTGNDNDAAAPKLLFAEADTFKLVAKFNEPIRKLDVVDTDGNVVGANVSLQCPTGVTVSLTGKKATYNARFRELQVEGVGLPPGQTCQLTIGTGVRDLAGNSFSSADADKIANFQILNAATTGGFIGSGNTGDFMSTTNFATFAQFPQRCNLQTMVTGKTTNFMCELPVPASLATGAKLLLTFPSGFNVSSVAAVAASASPNNGDLNGPGPGTTTISGVSNDTTSNTVTVTLAHSGTAMNTSDMVRFDMSGLVTPSTSNASAQVSVVVKDADGVKVGQTINTQPFAIQAAGDRSISGLVYKGASTGISGVRVFCDSIGGFGASAAFAGHQETTTAGDGTWSITGLSDGQYNCGLPPDPTTLANLGGGSTMQMVSVSGGNKTGVNFGFTDLSSTGKTLTVSITGPASKAMDVFCQAGGDANFSAPTMKTVTLNGAGSGSTTVKLQGGKTYTCGVGPHIAFESLGSGNSATVPTFDFMPPKPVQVVVPTDANPTAISFALLSALNQVTGTVKDGSNAAVASVFISARPIGCYDPATGAAKDCNGGFSQSKSDGTFTLNLVPGTYEVGAHAPGMPPSAGVEITVAADGAVSGGAGDGNSTADVTSGGVLVTAGNPFVIKILKTSVTVSGTVKDESSNGIKYAQVHAEKIVAGGTCTSFTPAGGGADAPTDSSGNYTLYVSNGTWCIRAFSPTYGEVGNATVVISSDTSATGQNITATAASYGTVSGTVTKNSAATSGAFVNCYGSSGGNQTQSGADGTYSMKLKAGTYTCEGFIPGAGPLSQSSGVAVTGSGSTTVNLTMGNPGTVRVIMCQTPLEGVCVTGDSGRIITDAFIDLRSSTGRGAGTGQNDNGVYTIVVPAGTYTLRGGSPKYGDLCLSQAITVTAGVSQNVICTPPTTLRSVGGRVTDGSANLSGATITMTSSATGRAFTSQTDAKTGSTNNISLTNVPDGTYTLSVSKKGYETTSTTATVSGGDLTIATPVAITPASGASGTSVTVSVQASSTTYQGGAHVIATNGNKVVAIETDQTSGQASVPLTNGTWTVKAIGDNGKESASTTVTVASGSLSGSAPTLSLSTSISGYTAATDTATVVPTTGGLISASNITGLALNIPASTLSTTDSNTGKIEIATDPTVKDIDPGADMNFVGKNGFEITPKDSSGNAITTVSGDAVTLTIPYTDADVSAAGVAESKLLCGTFNVATQAWETLPTTVDTTNNLLTCTTTHFSSFGVLGSVSLAASTGSADLTPPDAPKNLAITSDGAKSVLTWTDPVATDFRRLEVLRNAGGNSAVDGSTPIAVLAPGVQTYSDTSVTAGTSYTYQLRVKDASGNQALSDELKISIQAAQSVSVPVSSGGGGGGAPAPTVSTPVTTSTTTATPQTPAPTAAPVAKLIHDPAELNDLLKGLGLTADPSTVAKYQPLVKSDAIAFKVGLTAEQESALANFVSYGNSTATVKLGAGERRALVRDYLETVGRANVSWDDLDRMARGTKPEGRNLAKEQAKVKEALPLWLKIKGKNPNFKNASEDLAWNTLMYRIRFTRDLVKESVGISKFRAVMKRIPTSPMDWAMVRALGYVL